MQKKLLAVFSAVAIFAPTALAQTSAATGTSTVQSPPVGAAPAAGPAGRTEVVPPGTVRISDISRASRILNRDVYNRADEKIGDIEELIVDPKSGQVQQVVLGVGGFLGIGQKLVAVPFNEIKVEEVTIRPVTTPAPAPAPAGPGAAAATPGTAAPVAGVARPAGAPAAEPITRARFIVDMTKEQAKAAPEFRYDRP